MKLGLITDIHEDVENLAAALDLLRNADVDKIVMIGDVVGTADRLEETCRLLAEADVCGVWGNHDFGLCVEPGEYLRDRFSPVVINYMTSLKPRLEIEGCLFMHVEPWLDPENVADLWYFHGPPETDEQLARIFNATSHRIMFSGHYHRWLLARPEGLCNWQGEAPIHLADNRYYMVINALCEGRFATLDTETSELCPFNL